MLFNYSEMWKFQCSTEEGKKRSRKYRELSVGTIGIPQPRSRQGFTVIFCDALKGEMLKTLSKVMKNKYIAQDRIAMRIADRYGMTHEYKTARRHHLTPLEALEDWDLIMPEEKELFKS